MKVLTAAQMREVDRLTTERYGVPGIQLMESAAARVVEQTEKRIGSLRARRALVVCGKGNNGGDGAAIARRIHAIGADVRLLLLGRAAETAGDARTNFERALELAAKHPRNFSFNEVQTVEKLRTEISAAPYDVCFDAMLGTGLTRPATGLIESAIDFINGNRAAGPIVAVDIPSGVPSDSAELIGPAVRAHFTVTFTAPKIGSVLPPASHCGGELIVADIGSPDELVNSCGSRMTLVESETVRRWLEASRRDADANKGAAGKVLLVAGSRGKTGAATLCGEAALRSGAGLVTIAAPESSQPIIASRVIAECMTEALSETRSGAVSADAIDRALELAAERDVVAIGPGLGSSDPSTREFVAEFVEARERPMVLDADALNSLAPWADGLTGNPRLPLILTPHPGEMARLVSEDDVSEVLRYRVETAHEFATTHRVILVLKGSRTLIASPDGEVYVNPTGNAGMATGGTGDVLTGLIAGMLAQKKDDALAATVSAVYLHGLAGDIAAARLGTRAMIASDVIASLGDAFIEAGGDAEKLIRQPGLTLNQ
jgi:NAD(P)H-hydrate epimerase